MKLARVALPDGAEIGAVVDGDRVFPLPDGLLVEDLIGAGLGEALRIGERARSSPGVALADVRLLLPYRPPAVRDFVTFESHVEGVRQSIEKSPGVPGAWYDAPTFYFTNPHALFGPGDAIPRPKTCRALDYELEVACVVVGDLLASGTTGGGGCLAELWGRRGTQTPSPLEPGDVVRIDVEGIGFLEGSVA